jgi:hypothetical protein
MVTLSYPIIEIYDLDIHRDLKRLVSDLIMKRAKVNDLVQLGYIMSKVIGNFCPYLCPSGWLTYLSTWYDFQMLGVHTPLLFSYWKGVNAPVLFSIYPFGVPPQFQRLFVEVLLVWPKFAEVLLVCAGPAIWLKTA